MKNFPACKESNISVYSIVSLDLQTFGYCKCGNFCENFIFANIVKRHICYVKNSRLGHDLPRSVNDKSDFDISRGFYFHKTSHMRSFVKIKPLLILECEFFQIHSSFTFEFVWIKKSEIHEGSMWFAVIVRTLPRSLSRKIPRRKSQRKTRMTIQWFYNLLQPLLLLHWVGSQFTKIIECLDW